MSGEERTALIQGAVQCAPALAGMKPSNLLILEDADSHLVRRILWGTGLSCEFLYAGKQRDVWLVYWKDALEEILEDAGTKRFLKKLGYSGTALDDVLDHLRKRYRKYWEGKEEYPHELGILLGYPLGDVIGFIVHKGKDFLCSGYWKVYENAEAARRTFEKYRYARRVAHRLACQGKRFRDMRRAFCGQIGA